MGQSNSTSPLDAEIKPEQYKDFNYSRLILFNNNNLNNLKQPQPLFRSSSNPQTNDSPYYKLHKFQSLSGDDLLVKDRQNKILSLPSSSLGTLRNISNLKLTKQASSFLSRSKITSIANLQLPQQQAPVNQTQSKSRVSHVKFASNQRIIFKNFVFSKTFDEQTKKYFNKIINCFLDQQSMQNYVSNLVKLNQVLQDFSLYDDFNIVQQEQLFIVERTYVETIDLTQGRLTRSQLKQNVPKLLDYLHFLAKIYEKIDHIYVDPEDVYFYDEEFYLVDFKYKQTTPSEMILATLQWVFKGNSDVNEIMQQRLLKIPTQNQKTLQECFFRRDELQNSSSFPLYIRQLWKNLVDHKITRPQLLPYIQRLKFKAFSLSMNIDSFHACLNHKRTYSFHEEKHCWLIGKRVNELYFYNMSDDHRCQVKVVRKKKKIDLSQIKIIFDPEQLDIKYIAQNSKIIIHIAEFQLEKSSCKSDIQIKHRLPVKFKNPSLFYNPKKQEIFILQNSVYKYSIIQNKLSQQTKKINEHIFLARSHDFEFMVVRMSVDIFRNGIRVFLNQLEIDLFFVGDKDLLEEMLNVRVDIRSVEFCKEIYKGVYLMMASRNLWILDLNFNIFFSYATIQRVKSFYGFASVANSTSASKSKYIHRRNFSRMNESSGSTDYAFEVFNQPFKVEFLTHQDGLNVRIKDDQLHVIGDIEGNLYYLKYGFLPEAGSLRLLEYKPLMGVNSKKQQVQSQGKIKGSILSIKSKEEKIPKKVTIGVSHVDYIDESHIDEDEKNSTVMPIVINGPKLRGSRRSREEKKIEINKEYELAAPLVINRQTHQIYRFNFHQENLLEYKTQCWLYFQQRYFVTVQDFYLKANKTNYQIQLKIKKVNCSLKDLIEKLKKYNEDKSAKQKKYFSREDSLFYMIRCVDIYLWLIKNQLYHKNLSVANYYFMAHDNSLRLIGWSEPQRNWFVSDFKDLLLVFFNIMTCNTLQKLNQKMLYKYKSELQQFSLVYDKMLNAFKYNKVSQKKAQIAKQVKQIKDYLFNQVCNRFLLQISTEQLQQNRGKMDLTEADLINSKEQSQNKSFQNGYVFNFEYNTPRFSMICLLKRKLKKMRCLIDENSKQEFIFQSSDKYLWDGEKSRLYIFTSTYQFYELKINTTNFKQQVIVCEEYEYLPNNILDSTFILTPSHGIISVGGVYKAKNTELTFNKTVYKFNPQKLTWDPLCQIPQPKINPYLALSNTSQQIYCFAGQIQHSSQSINVIKISLSNKPSPKVQLLKDSFKFNPFSQIPAGYPTRIYNLSSSYLLFLLFSITSEKYIARVFSLNSFCVDHSVQTKNYSDDNKNISSSVGITLNKDNIHVLRQYGKHAKISLNKLESLVITNETIYPERQDKVE